MIKFIKFIMPGVVVAALMYFLWAAGTVFLDYWPTK